MWHFIGQRLSIYCLSPVCRCVILGGDIQRYVTGVCADMHFAHILMTFVTCPYWFFVPSGCFLNADHTTHQDDSQLTKTGGGQLATLGILLHRPTQWMRDALVHIMSMLLPLKQNIVTITVVSVVSLYRYVTHLTLWRGAEGMTGYFVGCLI